MPEISYREIIATDMPALARLRAQNWETEEYWLPRVTGYFNGESNPQQALAPRIGFVAQADGETIGFVAGHLTTRFGCEGELEWINVHPDWRGKGVSVTLLRMLARWFVEQKAYRICVNVAPDNIVAQAFYRKCGAESWNEHWLYWRDIRPLVAE